ncbi:MAG: Ribulose-phosphate 3-epimerase [Firmicutes bacterium]|nr:Ribulose-phosphate 3-epimerase [Bacillota bacterium]MDI6705481.1 ribulose-phosphate 3-epimerase [Bacillota bacterium]
MIKLAPSILSANFADLGGEIKRAERGGADLIHIDVMDGHFVPNITIGPPVIKSIRGVTKLPFDVHLMIDRADCYIEDFAKAGADIITVHWEASTHLNRTLQRIKEAGLRAGVSINPATPVSVLQHVLEDVDLVLVMSVNPGFGGQKFIKGALEKIRELDALKRDACYGYEIEVDGGVNLENAAAIIEAGATILVAGSSVYGAEHVEERVKEFKRICYGLREC